MVITGGIYLFELSVANGITKNELTGTRNIYSFVLEKETQK